MVRSNNIVSSKRKFSKKMRHFTTCVQSA